MGKWQNTNWDKDKLQFAFFPVDLLDDTNDDKSEAWLTKEHCNVSLINLRITTEPMYNKSRLQGKGN